MSNKDIKNLTIVVLMCLLLMSSVINILYLNRINMGINKLKTNSYGTSILKQHFEPITPDEFAKIKEEIKRLSKNPIY